MTFETVERYLYAATKDLPKKSRADIERELRADIADMLDARCQGRAVEESDICAVLEGFGPPEALARRYGAREGRGLISPLWYGPYKAALAVSLGGCAAIHFAVWGIGTLISLLKGSGISVAPSPLFLLRSFFTWAFPLFAVVTLVVALLDRLGVPGRREQPADWISALPPIPTEKARISRGESIVGVVGAAVMVTVMLNFSALSAAAFAGQGPIQLLSPQAEGRFVAGAILLFLLAGIVHLFALVEGRYSVRYAAVSTTLHLFTGGIAYFSLRIQPFFSGELIALVEQNTSADFLPLFLHLNDIVLACILFSLVLDTAETIYRTARYGCR